MGGSGNRDGHRLYFLNVYIICVGIGVGIGVGVGIGLLVRISFTKSIASTIQQIINISIGIIIVSEGVSQCLTEYLRHCSSRLCWF